MQSILLGVLLALTTIVSASCPSAMPLSLCCLTLEPFSANEYVWENECGATVPDTSLLTASGCEVNVPCEGQEWEGMYAACCEEYLNCPSEDGAVAYNCTGTVVE
ncbi:hypothetical protein DAEQUDRAFT_728906 [Daedalea quercina L-15889]|uniref:Uncharacterized protein n=1 Tax=Daedalea quercina L-15889 TaxID=1314783 RepID=A0A165P234_9APHY|nr:hypothetical protein DAEQUDRAFT_728906 [Daedalea quercina L-15889]